MPYRLRDSCALCRDASAKARCLRCGAPLCAVHAHGARERCAHCEQEFETPAEPTTVVDWALRIGLVIALGGISVTGLVIGFASPTSFLKWQVLFLLSPWFVLTMALAIVGLVFGIRAGAWYARWRFLRDRLGRGRSDQPGG